MDIKPLDPPSFEGYEAIEILRVWLDRGTQKTEKFALLPQISKDPAAWGLILVDIARQVALGYEQTSSGGMDYTATLLRIKQGFDVEWEYPTG